MKLISSNQLAIPDSMFALLDIIPVVFVSYFSIFWWILVGGGEAPPDTHTYFVDT